ncbi:hypothetical protein H2200_009308 [Cladophialophora chaetospira]|uniref:Uncharacterized protein n=1 Tax=Cladophialophora chaetospira TaxID=386627 RepID=A0AA38X3V4_9EURO|nr:hypothetical protein H2200_009308 [Cladophialophora chaetospira]
MAPQESPFTDRLAVHIHSNNNFVDRLLQLPVRELRTHAAQNAAADTLSTGKRNQRTGAVAVQRLEKEMEALTDPEMLSPARAYQQGLKDGVYSFAY